MTYISIALIIMILVVIVAISTSGNERRLQEWNDARFPFTQTDFTKYFTQQGFDEDIVVCFYSLVIEYINLKNCKLHPQDRLTKVWSIYWEDLEYLIIPNIFKALSIVLPSDEEIEQYRRNHTDFAWDTPVFLIGFLQELRNKNDILTNKKHHANSFNY